MEIALQERRFDEREITAIVFALIMTYITTPFALRTVFHLWFARELTVTIREARASTVTSNQSKRSFAGTNCSPQKEMTRMPMLSRECKNSHRHWEELHPDMSKGLTMRSLSNLNSNGKEEASKKPESTRTCEIADCIGRTVELETSARLIAWAMHFTAIWKSTHHAWEWIIRKYEGPLGQSMRSS